MLRRAAHRLLPETLVLANLCAFDMLFTVILLINGWATEANTHIMAVYVEADRNLLVFVGAKMLLSFVPLGLLEFVRRWDPGRAKFVSLIIKLCIVGFILLYVVGSLAVNLRQSSP